MGSRRAHRRSKLTPKQRLFAREYADDHNATQAAIRAGYSERSAGSQAHDLLKKPEIQELVAKHERKRDEKRVLQVERMDELLDDVQQAVLTDAYNEDGTLKPPHEWPERLRRAATKIKSREVFDSEGELVGYVREVALEAKTPAIALGYRRRGVLVEKHQVELVAHAELVAAAAGIFTAQRAQAEAPLALPAETH